MIAYLRGETGGDMVAALLSDPDAECIAHSVNLCEVYYDNIRAVGIQRAKQVNLSLYADGVVESRVLNRDFWQRVGEHKARGAIALPDCFCISVAQLVNGEVVTSDHKEYDQIASLNVVPVLFIR